MLIALRLLFALVPLAGGGLPTEHQPADHHGLSDRARPRRERPMREMDM
jgi:hypothetical protein